MSRHLIGSFCRLRQALENPNHSESWPCERRHQQASAFPRNPQNRLPDIVRHKKTHTIPSSPLDGWNSVWVAFESVAAALRAFRRVAKAAPVQQCFSKQCLTANDARPDRPAADGLFRVDIWMTQYVVVLTCGLHYIKIVNAAGFGVANALKTDPDGHSPEISVIGCHAADLSDKMGGSQETALRFGRIGADRPRIMCRRLGVRQVSFADAKARGKDQTGAGHYAH